MNTTQVAKKGRYMTNRKYHFFVDKNKQVNEVLFDLNNPVFETV
jgi:hypothetical protein